MNIYKTLTKELRHSSTKNIAKKLGYNSAKLGKKSIAKFLSHKDLYSWLNSGFYDFKYTAEKFYRELCRIYDVKEEALKEELECQESLKVEMKKYQNCYIFVNTNFRRGTEPIFVLAVMESERHLKIDVEQFIFKTDDEVLGIVSNMIKTHYKKVAGTLAVWGDIADYVYHHCDGSVYAFDGLGEPIEKTAVIESRASLKLK